MKLVRSLLLPVLCWCAMCPQKTIAPGSRTSLGSSNGTASFAGTVINSVNHEPLADVHIMLVGYGSGREPSVIYGAMSDVAGHFSIQGVAPAAYFIALERRDFIQVRGQGAVTKNAAELKPGQRLKDVILAMAPRSIIAGRVLDEYGDPMMGVSIAAVPVSAGDFPGFRGQVGTDDRGEFRLSVPPGKYYVKAQHWEASQGVAEVRSDGTTESDFLETYYPDATTTDSATSVEVGAGRETDDVEIHLAKSPVLSISGTVAGIPEDALYIGIVMESGPNASEVRSSSSSGWGASTRQALTDKFQFGHLAAGFYRIYATCSSGGLALQSQVAEISLSDASIEDVHLTLAPGFDVTGKVELEKSSLAPAASAENRKVNLMPAGGGSLNVRVIPAEVAANGGFTIKNVFADRYRVEVEPLSENGFVKTVRLNGALVPDGILDFSSGTEGSELKITVSANGGQISGKVESDKASPPFALGYVVLYPDLPDLPSQEQLRFSELSEDSSYTFHGLSPGKYRLLALPREFGEFRDTLKRYRSHADVVEIKEGDKMSRNLKIAAEDDEHGTAK